MKNHRQPFLSGGIIQIGIGITEPTGKFQFASQGEKFMPQMMMDILQYIPYAILIAAVFFLLFGGAIYTIQFFRKANRRTVN